MNKETVYYGYCPFCSLPLSFKKEHTDLAHNCPICNGPISFEFSSDLSNVKIIANLNGATYNKDGFIVKNGVLIEYQGDSIEIKIPEDVKAIGVEAFKNNKSIKEVKIPKNVSYICESAFEGCVGIRKVFLSNGIIAIANCAFKNCRRLEEITIPESLIAAGYELFNGCDNLKECILPMNMKRLGGSPYTFCKNLKKANIPHCVTDTSHWFAENNNLETIILGNGVRWLNCIVSPKLSYVHFPNTEGWEVFKYVFDENEYAKIPTEDLKNPKKAAITLKKLAKAGKTIYIPQKEMPSISYYYDLSQTIKPLD